MTSASRPSETLGIVSRMSSGSGPGGASRRSVPAASARRRAPASSPIHSVGSVTTTSRWTGTVTVPPIPALAPNAMCAVPRIFSSSRMLPVSVARSFVPTPSSARLRPSGPWASSIARYCSASSPLPVAPASRPSRTVSRTGCSVRPTSPSEDVAIVPSPPSGRDEALAARQVAERAGRAEVALVGDRRPPAQVEADVGAVRDTSCAPRRPRSAAPPPRGSARASASKSVLIRRASMSAVTPGSVAPRWPSSHARLRALVCDSDGRHGAMNTSAAANAAATGAGGSVPRAGLGGRIVSTASPPAARAAASSASPIVDAAGVGDDEHRLPRPHAQAALDDGGDGLLELAHRVPARARLSRRSRPRP